MPPANKIGTIFFGDGRKWQPPAVLYPFFPSLLDQPPGVRHQPKEVEAIFPQACRLAETLRPAEESRITAPVSAGETTAPPTRPRSVQGLGEMQLDTPTGPERERGRDLPAGLDSLRALKSSAISLLLWEGRHSGQEAVGKLLRMQLAFNLHLRPFLVRCYLTTGSFPCGETEGIVWSWPTLCFYMQSLVGRSPELVAWSLRELATHPRSFISSAQMSGLASSRLHLKSNRNFKKPFA